MSASELINARLELGHGRKGGAVARMKKLGGLFIVREILFLTDAKADGRELTQNGRRKKEEEHYQFQREWTLKKIKNKGMKTSLSTLSRGWEGGRGKRERWSRDGAV